MLNVSLCKCLAKAWLPEQGAARFLPRVLLNVKNLLENFVFKIKTIKCSSYTTIKEHTSYPFEIYIFHFQKRFYKTTIEVVYRNICPILCISRMMALFIENSVYHLCLRRNKKAYASFLEKAIHKNELSSKRKKNFWKMSNMQILCLRQ